MTSGFMRRQVVEGALPEAGVSLIHASHRKLTSALEVSPMSATDRIFIDRLEKDNLVIEGLTIQRQFQIKSGILGLDEIRVLEGDKGNNPPLATIIFD